jgi:hypothetical protein
MGKREHRAQGQRKPIAADDTEEVTLSGAAAEFRTALREEIEAARRSAASSAVQLVNGRLLAPLGGSFQYQFTLESALQLPEDSPGDLHVPQHPPLDATVVAVKGTLVTISIPESLGEFIPRATLQTNLVFLLRKLIERVESYPDGSNIAGDRIIRPDQPPRRLSDPPDPPRFNGNREQLEAVTTALSWDTSFIWGPPGTGKTRTIGEIGRAISKQAASLLIVSHTNAAVDQAILAVAESLGSELVDGSVIRVGNPVDRQLQERPRLLARTHVDERSSELAARRDDAVAARALLVEESLRVQRRLSLAEWAAVAGPDFDAMEDQLHSIEMEADALNALAGEIVALNRTAEVRREREQSAQAAIELESGSHEWIREGDDAVRALADLEAAESAAREALAQAQELYVLVTSTSGLMRRWKGLPKPEDQAEEVATRRVAYSSASESADSTRQRIEALRVRVSEAEGELREFRETWGVEPAVLLKATQDQDRRYKQLEQESRARYSKLASEQTALHTLIERRLESLEESGLSVPRADSPRAAISVMRDAHVDAVRELAGETPEVLRVSLADLNSRISALDDELARIEELLARVEETIIAEAGIVGTTLTRAYLRDSIQGRRFDTVILDEASMAPIPALWAAAYVADRGVVIVGDFRQLAPIHHSGHELAKKWLGTDIFERADVRRPYEAGNAPSFCATLTEQHRMHPAISEIPNRLIYGSRLRDAADTADESELAGWFDLEWGHDNPVLLVDTQGLDAWVTSVKRAHGASRLNFLSATVCVDLAAQVLRRDRPDFVEGGRPRVMIVCPYRPHARLLSLLAREEFADGEVVAGTAHTFQGSEASTLIFDLVNDEPHWRVAMFDPQRDEDTQRLINVALTRARRRLIVVGDFEYVERNAKRAFTGKLVRYLRESFPSTDVLDILPEGFAARAARSERLVMPVVETPAEGSRVVVTQEHFFPLLRRDLEHASRRIVIYSPFITDQRISLLQADLRAAIERGVNVFVITKAPSERRKREAAAYTAIEAALRGWGITVIHKFHMHEKVVFVDDRILWQGSLNPLSFSDTQEVMERRDGREVVEHYSKTLRLEKLLDLYMTGQGQCPFCGSELMPAEGRDEPFYWRCVEDGCHTRGIFDDAPRDGRVVCSSCGGVVYYGMWGDEPHWRCETNRRHRMRIARSHIRLPKMRAIIPPKELRELDSRFGVSSSQALTTKAGREAAGKGT